MINKLKYSLLTSVVFMSFLAANAAVQNQILSSGVRKVSDNTINFTFYTQGENLEKPIVKSKGNNEYTILLPNMSDNTSRPLNISATEGIVTSADVKTINEGAVTYTKINLKTSKPVTINAETRKTTQSAGDLSKIDSIMSKVNLINQDIKNTNNYVQNNSTSTVTEPAPIKASSVKDIIRQNSSIAPKKNPIQEAVAVRNVSAHTPDIKKIEKSENSTTKSENIKNIKPVSNTVKPKATKSKPSTTPAKSINNTKKETVKEVENKQVETAIANIAATDSDVSVLPIDNDITNEVQDTATQNSEEKTGFNIFKSLKNILVSPLTWLVLLMCGILAVFGYLFKKLTSNISASNSINDSFIEKLNSVLNKPKKKDYSGIVNAENMNWQEKYRAFNEKSNEVDESEKKKIDANYVLELSNKKKDEDNNHVNDDETSRFKGFDGNTGKSIPYNKPSKSYKLKSFRNESGTKQTMREKLDKLMEGDIANSNEQNALMTNTIKPKSNPENMLIIDSKAIDENREFYIVKENEEYSLIGRIKNKLMILKKYGYDLPEDLQIHRANGNTFTVKTGNERLQVEVNETDMNIYSQV